MTFKFQCLFWTLYNEIFVYGSYLHTFFFFVLRATFTPSVVSRVQMENLDKTICFTCSDG